MFQTSENTFDESVHIFGFDRFNAVRTERYRERHTLFALAYLLAHVNIEKFHGFYVQLASRTNNVLDFSAGNVFVRNEREISFNLGEFRKRFELERNGKFFRKRVVIEL